MVQGWQVGYRVVKVREAHHPKHITDTLRLGPRVGGQIEMTTDGNASDERAQETKTRGGSRWGAQKKKTCKDKLTRETGLKGGEMRRP